MRKLSALLAVNTVTLFWVCLAFANPKPPSASLVHDNPEMFAWLFGIMLAAGFMILGSMIHFSHQNNKKQWEKLDNHETRISTLEGAHRANHG